MRAFGLTCVVGLLLAVPSSALGKQTADFTFKSSGKAAAPGAVVGLNEDGTFEDFPVTVAADDADGQMSVEIHWDNQFDDWDLYVYKKNSTGGLDQVGSSAGGPPSQDEATVVTAPSGPLDPGSYVIRAQNYAASSPNFTGFAKFSNFIPANVIPTASLAVPATAASGQPVTLDASGSRDPDGRIVNYAWDLDGNGSIETDGGASATLVRTFTTGVHHVTVRVTDDKGARAYANKTVTVGSSASAKPT